MHPAKENDYLKLIIELLRQGKTVKVGVRGWSMFPFLWPGDIVRVSSAGNFKIKPGMVVVHARDDGLLVAHRVVRGDLTNGTWVTRGDSNLKADTPVPATAIAGVVTGIEKSSHFAAKMAIGKWGRLLATTAPVSGPLFFYMGIITRMVIEAVGRITGGEAKVAASNETIL